MPRIKYIEIFYSLRGFLRGLKPLRAGTRSGPQGERSAGDLQGGQLRLDKGLVRVQFLQDEVQSVKSGYLKEKLFEVFLEYDDITAIFHSVNPILKNKLCEMGIFETKSQESLIDQYVNSYY